MPGTYQYDVEIKSNVAKLLSDISHIAFETAKMKIATIINILTNIKFILDAYFCLNFVLSCYKLCLLNA